jgi:hypothetical protein
MRPTNVCKGGKGLAGVRAVTQTSRALACDTIADTRVTTYREQQMTDEEPTTEPVASEPDPALMARVEGADAKVLELTAQIAELTAANNALKAANYDLLMAATPGDDAPADGEEESPSVDDDEDFNLDDVTYKDED